MTPFPLPGRTLLRGLLAAAALLPFADATAQLPALAADKHWVSTWAVSPQTQEPFGSAPAATAPIIFNATLRQIVHTSIGGGKVRVRFSNTFGTTALVIGSASVGVAGIGAQVNAGTVCALTFSGRTSVTVPPGALVVSDAAALEVPVMGDLAVSIYLPNATAGTTHHGLAQQSQYICLGDQTAALDPRVSLTISNNYFLKNVDVLAPRQVGAVVCLGDSITDGAGSTVNANRRWPNLLAQRLLARANRAHDMGVLDQGISGNRLCHNQIGPALLSRFDTDVVAQAGVTKVILLAGINDIGFAEVFPAEAVSAEDIIAAYRQIIARAHEAGLTICGGTLTPFAGATAPYYSEIGETKRQAVNDFIRTGGEFDGVIDFEAALRDSSTPPRLRPEFDSGDGLHPNDAGYAAMAAAVKLKLLKNNP